MQDIYQDQYIQACNSGQLDEAKKMVNQNGVDLNFQDKEGNTGLHVAAQSSKINIIRYLLQSEIQIDTPNYQGKTALHFACDKADKEVILILLMAGIDFEILDENKQKAGQDNMDSKMFMNNIIPEKEAFNALPKEEKTKLIEIFNDIDYDMASCLDFEKAKRFNKFLEDTATDSIIEKDAKDFIKWTAICNKETVNIDEWLFAFGKLYATDLPAYNKFIEDYNVQVAKKGALKNQDFDQDQQQI